MARGAGAGEGADLAGFQVWRRDGGRRAPELGVPAEHRRHRRPAARGRQVTHAQATGGLEQHLRRHVRGAVGPGRREGDLARAPLRVVDEVLEILPGRLGVHHDDHGVGVQPRDAGELIAAERGRPPEDRVDFRQERDRRHGGQQRVPIGLGDGHRLHAHRAGGAGLVGDDDRLLEHALERRRQRASGEVRHTAGRERVDERDGPVPVLLLGQGAGARKSGDHRQNEHDQGRKDRTAHRAVLALVLSFEAENTPARLQWAPCPMPVAALSS